MSMVFKRGPLGDMPNILDEFYRNAWATYQRNKGQRFQELCEGNGWVYELHRIVCILHEGNKELYYYRTDDGLLHPLVALAPTEVSWHDSPTDFSVKVKYEQRELDMDEFKPHPYPSIGPKKWL